ncbi:helix-turn-helix transcriptional regulator [Bacillus glycinifermentans]|uniref:helix-turn-helix domain-containing protein n=1 Tax=Bacillus glycinifermentans TaxID=1664069 RepID=UPI001583AF38|nr:helix-turn-helix transcriptional regulator [Bacillus glycinifermentans]NUJ16151.1 helix-turn-helix transcriptional regulator [Bacillus glycinifermentans]
MFWEELRLSRERCGLSIRDLSAISSLSEEAIACLEAETEEVDEQQLEQLARSLNVSPGYLLGIEPAPNVNQSTEARLRIQGSQPAELNEAIEFGQDLIGKIEELKHLSLVD